MVTHDNRVTDVISQPDMRHAILEKDEHLQSPKESGDGESIFDKFIILMPTCWTCSPRDNAGLPGPLEKALEGTAVSDASQPIEVLRIVQSYDPYLSCAAHQQNTPGLCALHLTQ